MATQRTRTKKFAQKRAAKAYRNIRGGGSPLLSGTAPLFVGFPGTGGPTVNPFGPPLPPGPGPQPPGPMPPGPGPTQPPTGGPSGPFSGPISTICATIENPTLRALCELGGGIGSRFLPGAGTQECPEGKVRIGNTCVDPGAAFPGGEPFLTTAGGVAVQGAFGMPAITPDVEARQVRDCPDGMVLGKDNLCYPKAILSRRSRFRKWRQPRRPLLTAGDLNAIRRAERLKGRVKDVGKDLGLKVTNR